MGIASSSDTSYTHPKEVNYTTKLLSALQQEYLDIPEGQKPALNANQLFDSLKSTLDAGVTSAEWFAALVELMEERRGRKVTRAEVTEYVARMIDIGKRTLARILPAFGSKPVTIDLSVDTSLGLLATILLLNSKSIGESITVLNLPTVGGEAFKQILKTNGGVDAKSKPAEKYTLKLVYPNDYRFSGFLHLAMQSRDSLAFAKEEYDELIKVARSAKKFTGRNFKGYYADLSSISTDSRLQWKRVDIYRTRRFHSIYDPTLIIAYTLFDQTSAFPFATVPRFFVDPITRAVRPNPRFMDLLVILSEYTRVASNRIVRIKAVQGGNGKGKRPLEADQENEGDEPIEASQGGSEPKVVILQPFNRDTDMDDVEYSILVHDTQVGEFDLKKQAETNNRVAANPLTMLSTGQAPPTTDASKSMARFEEMMNQLKAADDPVGAVSIALRSQTPTQNRQLNYYEGEDEDDDDDDDDDDISGRRDEYPMAHIVSDEKWNIDVEDLDELLKKWSADDRKQAWYLIPFKTRQQFCLESGYVENERQDVDETLTGRQEWAQKRLLLEFQEDGIKNGYKVISNKLVHFVTAFRNLGAVRQASNYDKDKNISPRELERLLAKWNEEDRKQVWFLIPFKSRQTFGRNLGEIEDITNKDDVNQTILGRNSSAQKRLLSEIQEDGLKKGYNVITSMIVDFITGFQMFGANRQAEDYPEDYPEDGEEEEEEEEEDDDSDGDGDGGDGGDGRKNPDKDPIDGETLKSMSSIWSAAQLLKAWNIVDEYLKLESWWNNIENHENDDAAALNNFFAKLNIDQKRILLVDMQKHTEGITLGEAKEIAQSGLTEPAAKSKKAAPASDSNEQYPSEEFDKTISKWKKEKLIAAWKMIPDKLKSQYIEDSPQSDIDALNITFLASEEDDMKDFLLELQTSGNGLTKAQVAKLKDEPTAPKAAKPKSSGGRNTEPLLKSNQDPDELEEGTKENVEAALKISKNWTSPDYHYYFSDHVARYNKLDDKFKPDGYRNYGKLSLAELKGLFREMIEGPGGDLFSDPQLLAKVKNAAERTKTRLAEAEDPETQRKIQQAFDQEVSVLKELTDAEIKSSTDVVESLIHKRGYWAYLAAVHYNTKVPVSVKPADPSLRYVVDGATSLEDFKAIASHIIKKVPAYFLSSHAVKAGTDADQKYAQELAADRTKTRLGLFGKLIVKYADLTDAEKLKIRGDDKGAVVADMIKKKLEQYQLENDNDNNNNNSTEKNRIQELKDGIKKNWPAAGLRRYLGMYGVNYNFLPDMFQYQGFVYSNHGPKGDDESREKSALLQMRDVVLKLIDRFPFLFASKKLIQEVEEYVSALKPVEKKTPATAAEKITSEAEKSIGPAAAKKLSTSASAVRKRDEWAKGRAALKKVEDFDGSKSIDKPTEAERALAKKHREVLARRHGGGGAASKSDDAMEEEADQSIGESVAADLLLGLASARVAASAPARPQPAAPAKKPSPPSKLIAAAAKKAEDNKKKAAEPTEGTESKEARRAHKANVEFLDAYIASQRENVKDRIDSPEVKSYSDDVQNFVIEYKDLFGNPVRFPLKVTQFTGTAVPMPQRRMKKEEAISILDGMGTDAVVTDAKAYVNKLHVDNEGRVIISKGGYQSKYIIEGVIPVEHKSTAEQMLVSPFFVTTNIFLSVIKGHLIIQLIIMSTKLISSLSEIGEAIAQPAMAARINLYSTFENWALGFRKPTFYQEGQEPALPQPAGELVTTGWPASKGAVQVLVDEKIQQAFEDRKELDFSGITTTTIPGGKKNYSLVKYTKRVRPIDESVVYDPTAYTMTIVSIKKEKIRETPAVKMDENAEEESLTDIRYTVNLKFPAPKSKALFPAGPEAKRNVNLDLLIGEGQGGALTATFTFTSIVDIKTADEIVEAVKPDNRGWGDYYARFLDGNNAAPTMTIENEKVKEATK